MINLKDFYGKQIKLKGRVLGYHESTKKLRLDKCFILSSPEFESLPFKEKALDILKPRYNLLSDISPLAFSINVNSRRALGVGDHYLKNVASSFIIKTNGKTIFKIFFSNQLE